MLQTRIVTALVLLVVLATGLFAAPDWLWLGLVVVIVTAAAWEWQRLAGLESGVALAYAPITAALFICLAKWAPTFVVSLIWMVAAVFWLLVVPLWLLWKWPLQRIGVFNVFLGWLLLLPAGMVMLALRAEVSGWPLLRLLLVAWLADSFAYLFGRLFGRHKLAPMISPGKSWEGVFGALLTLAIYGWFVPVIPYLTQMQNHLIWLGVGLLLTGVSVVGDLLESLFKRQAGMKDSSQLLPGHGGVLDRIDSLLALLPVAMALNVLIQWWTRS